MTDTIKQIEEDQRLLEKFVSDRTQFGGATIDDAIQRSLLRDRVLQKIASGDDWFDIETAPKDSEMFLVKLPRMMGLVIRASFDRVHKQWLTDIESQGIDRVMFFHAGDVWKHIDGDKHIAMLLEREMKG